ncbi:MAG: hypothetical protein HQK51_08590 [Oligoflexia bacterium]|nr:hypothetical protein [Oligoflexia bacterium]
MKKLKLAMSIGNSKHYSFEKITRRHYLESAKECSISVDDFNILIDEVHESYKNLQLSIKESELDPLLDRETLNIILEGMKNRAKKIF